MEPLRPTPPASPASASPTERMITALLVDGPLTFHDVMALALYGPAGYYTRAVAPSAPQHPAFGAAIAVQLQRQWQALGQPARFSVIEPGAGGGWLARDILSYAHEAFPAFAAALDYMRLAPGPLAADWGDWPVRVLADEDALPEGLVGCVLAPGFFSALPLHWLFRSEHGWQEAIVRLDGEQLLLDWTEPTPPVRAAEADWPAAAPAGAQLGLGLAGKAFLGLIARRLAAGYVLVIDPGDREGASPVADTAPVRGLQDGEPVANPLEALGQMAIEGRVAFSLLLRWGQEAGLAPVGDWPQGAFLREHGLGYWEMFPADARARAAFEALGAGDRHALLLAKAAPVLSPVALDWAKLPRPAGG